MMKLKIFTDYQYLPKKSFPETLKYVPILAPFWGEISEEGFKKGRFASFLQDSDSFLEMSSLEEANIAIFPAYWHLISSDETAYNLLIQLAEKAKQANKLVAVFSQGDWNSSFEQDNILVFYTSSFQSSRKKNEFAMPEWTSDFVKTHLKDRIVLRNKQKKPKIGFCGYAPPLGVPLGIKKIKAWLRYGGDRLGITEKYYYKTGHTNRVRALSNLLKSSLVETNFIFRQRFAFANKESLQSTIDFQELEKIQRLEFCQNIIDSDYILCCSGYENYSIRFYEALSMGRIPIFLNTDCVLPYDFAIDWKKYCVWVDEDEIDLIAEKVADFHNSLSASEFKELQHECRRLWLDWISPSGFFRNLEKHILETPHKAKVQ